MNTATRRVDVVIVGAGLAGLTAADELLRQGLDVHVLEGRADVGGRLRSTEVAGYPVDAGATWIAPGHSDVRDLAARLNLEITPQFHEGKGVISFGGKRKVESATSMAPWVVADLARIMSKLQKLVDELPMEDAWAHPRAREHDAISIGEWLTARRALTGTRKFIGMFCMVHWGAPVSDISLFNVLRYVRTLGGIEHMMSVEGGDQQDRIRGTAVQLASGLSASLGPRVSLSSPVRRITTKGSTVTVETVDDVIAARAVIVAAAPSHRSEITFDPPLPDQHYGLARSWRLGALSKAFVAYDRPFWREDGLSGEGVSDRDTVFLTFDVSPSADGPGIIMAFCDSRGFDAYDEAERKRRVLEDLTHLFGARAADPSDYTDFSWGNDVFAPGGPNPAVAPLAWTAFGRFLREPVGLVHWAGTETADETSGTMNGAILSGRRAAREVVEQLGAAAGGASD